MLHSYKAKIHFLGTGTSQGVPVIGSNHPVSQSFDLRDRRLRTSLWYQNFSHRLSLVIDCGPDFREQMLRSGCIRLDALLITHEHSDHIAGLDDIRPFNQMQKAPLPLYAQPRVCDDLKKRFHYIFTTENRYPGAPWALAHPIDESSSFFINNLEIIPIPIIHGKLPILGFRIEDFAYITDASFISSHSIDKLRGIKVLVLNALRQEPEHPTHFVLSEALKIINELKPKKAFITHISQQMGFYKEVHLPKGVFLAYDGLVQNL